MLTVAAEHTTGRPSVANALQAWRRGLSPRTSQEAMAEKLGLKRSTYTAYELGAAKIPDEVMDRLIALGFTPALSLRRVHGTMPGRLRLYGSIGAGVAPRSSADFDTIDVPPSFGRPDWGALICEGDSMMPYLQPGDTLVFCDSIHLRRGLVFAFRSLDATEPEVKEIGFDAGSGWTLIPWNEQYDKRYMGADTPLGFLVGIISRDERFIIGPEPSGVTLAYIKQQLSSRLP